jgi:hypothetical protein
MVWKSIKAKTYKNNKFEKTREKVVLVIMKIEIIILVIVQIIVVDRSIGENV